MQSCACNTPLSLRLPYLKNAKELCEKESAQMAMGNDSRPNDPHTHTPKSYYIQPTNGKEKKWKNNFILSSTIERGEYNTEDVE